jgi:hypothetical protein
MIQEGMTATMVEASSEDSVRMGINLGPVKLVKDINGHPNIIGDGINVAQRIMSFARPGQIVVSRSYYDVVSNLASEYAKLFHYEGSRTDKHVREHEIYVVGHNEGALQKAKDGMKDRASSTTPNARKSSSSGAGTQTVTLSIPGFVQDKKKLSIVAGALGALVLVLFVLVMMKKPSNSEVAAATNPAATSPAPAEPRPAAAVAPPPAEPPKPVDTTKPEAKVVEPAPSPAVIPAPAPAQEPAKDAAKDAKKEGEKALKDKQAAEAAKSNEPPKSTLPPATLVFAVQPWGEVYVNGKSRGVSPPMKSLKLEPGKYKIEIRNTTFAVHTENLELKARDEITVRYKFQ